VGECEGGTGGGTGAQIGTRGKGKLGGRYKDGKLMGRGDSKKSTSSMGPGWDYSTVWEGVKLHLQKGGGAWGGGGGWTFHGHSWIVKNQVGSGIWGGGRSTKGLTLKKALQGGGGGWKT